MKIKLILARTNHDAITAWTDTKTLVRHVLQRLYRIQTAKQGQTIPRPLFIQPNAHLPQTHRAKQNLAGVECPFCGELIYFDEWDEDSSWAACPICDNEGYEDESDEDYDYDEEDDYKYEDEDEEDK